MLAIVVRAAAATAGTFGIVCLDSMTTSIGSGKLNKGLRASIDIRRKTNKRRKEELHIALNNRITEI
jgi:hypothetical protein